ncbi:MAG: TonB-dependent receptor domain-containing protein, partial [Woeseiaceae bacterium]
FRIIVLAASLFVAPAFGQQSANAVAFEIPKQAMASALLSFSEQANVQVIVDAEVVHGLLSPRVAGSMPPNDALGALLDQSGLTYKFSSARTVTILPNDGNQSREPESDDRGSRDSASPTGSDAESDDDSDGRDPQAAGSGSLLEELVVTAQKREESLQRTPISMAAFTSDQLEKASIVDLYDVAIQTPGMILNKEIVGKIYIRGIGAENLTIGGDPGVAVHADGAYIARTSAANFDLYDIERVEVLRGPQGTLYGRNATGGTINIISKAPTPELEGSVLVEYGDFDQIRVGGVLSGPLAGERVLARAAVVKSDRDGFTPNILTGEDLDDEDLLMGRLRLRFLPTDAVTIDLIADFSQDDGSPAPFKQLEFSDLCEGPNGANDPPGLRPVSQESPVMEKQDQFGITAAIDWKLEGLTFTSVTSYRDTEFEAIFDGDAVDITFQNFEDFDDTQQFSQEFRLASDSDERWSWILGAYYFNDDGDTRIFIPIPGFGFDILHLASISTDAFAVFGQATYNASERLALTVGLRYNSEDKEATQFSDFGFMPPLNQNLNEDSDELTPKFGIEYYASDNVMLYASATRGFKSGGFTFNGFQSNFEPEFVWAYETGIKSRLAGGAVILNGSVFYYDYTDLQVSKLENNAGVITNAADATIFGGEIELLAQPVDNWRVNAGLSLLNAEFDEFLTEDPSNPQLGTIDLNGNNLPRSPDFSANEPSTPYHSVKRVTWRFVSTTSIRTRASSRRLTAICQRRTRSVSSMPVLATRTQIEHGGLRHMSRTPLTKITS